MANRFPLIVDPANLNIKELPSGDNLDLTGSSIVNSGATITLPSVTGTLLTDAAIGSSVQAYDSDLTAWAGKTAPTGDAVGTTDTQILSNKTISVDDNTLSGIAASSFVLSNASGNIDGSVAQKAIPTGVVVGTTDTQTLSNKTVVALKETKVAMAANDVDLSLGDYFTKTISTTTAFTVSNVPSTGTATSFVLDLTNGGSATITWWSGVKWAGGTAPTLTASGRDVLSFFTHDGGTTWSGFILGKDVK